MYKLTRQNPDATQTAVLEVHLCKAFAVKKCFAKVYFKHWSLGWYAAGLDKHAVPNKASHAARQGLLELVCAGGLYLQGKERAVHETQPQNLDELRLAQVCLLSQCEALS